MNEWASGPLQSFFISQLRVQSPWYGPALCLWWSTWKLSSRTIAVNGAVMLLFDIVFLLLQYFTVEKLLKYLLELNIHLQFNIFGALKCFFLCFSLWVLCFEKFKVELNCSKWAELTSPDFVGNKLEFIWNKQI